MKKIWNFLRREIVLTVAWVLALISACFVTPDREYIDYIDLHTLGLLFALMAVMAGLRRLGLFRAVGEALLRRTGTTRRLEGALIFLPFFVSMAVTNDVALITFVPFALEVLTLSGRQKRIVPVVAMQTVAANLGSMATPIGNPQNLYLYAHYELPIGRFFAVTLPMTAVLLVLLAAYLLTVRSAPVTPAAAREDAPPIHRPKLILLLALFLLCLGAVAGIVPLAPVCAAVLIAMLILDRGALKQVDYALLATFVGFFVFVGNLGRIPAFARMFQRLLEGNEVLLSVAASQVISNVPAALLLSGFTPNGEALLLGVNLGGLGTLIASMASLISYKYVAAALPEQKGRYLLWFTAANVLFLVLLLGAWLILY